MSASKNVKLTLSPTAEQKFTNLYEVLMLKEEICCAFYGTSSFGFANIKKRYSLS